MSVIIPIEKIDRNLKDLILEHLNSLTEKIGNLHKSISDQSYREGIETEILEVLPQAFLHSSMVLRAINEDEFESRIDQMMALNKDAISALDMKQEELKQ